ncbi:Txe/YoeB family addiction module toxin [Nocardia abscessus]|uniref:Txe/YoeB family addiction module toxin n=1 Tax=Nocardia abscessus TaxID=120957 RepID=UPI0024573EB1|nr:Txe/YoeB family addiction module toxin [Nocardia abscessus]
MRVVFVKAAWEDYTHWVGTDRKVAIRINRLIDDIARDPFNGLGKPEPLRDAEGACWSRRIDSEHRLVYSVLGETVTVVQARYHY